MSVSEADNYEDHDRGLNANHQTNSQYDEQYSDQEEQDDNAEGNDLTTSVWVNIGLTKPHTKIFLHVVKKMYLEGLINLEDKG